LYRYYFKFRNKDKKVRWIYDRETDIWKKSRSSSYSDNFLNAFIVALLAFALFGSSLVIIFINLPFAGAVFALFEGEPLLLLVWVLYFIIMIAINKFTKSWWRFFIIGILASTLILFFSDILMNEYDTVFYYYLIYGFAICVLYLCFVRVLSYILRRRIPPKKPPKDKVKLSSF
jgi:hypothetical protein